MEVTGLVAACGSLASLGFKTAKAINDYRQKYREIPDTLADIELECSLQAATVGYIKQWLEGMVNARPEAETEFAPLKNSLDHTVDKMTVLLKDVEALAPGKGFRRLRRRKKLRFLWNETQMNTHLGELRWQSQALDRLLHASKLPPGESYRHVRRVTTAASVHYTGHCDSDDSQPSDVEFDFDHIVVRSAAYLRVYRKAFKTQNSKGKRRANSVVSTGNAAARNSTFSGHGHKTPKSSISGRSPSATPKKASVPNEPINARKPPSTFSTLDTEDGGDFDMNLVTQLVERANTAATVNRDYAEAKKLYRLALEKAQDDDESEIYRVTPWDISMRLAEVCISLGHLLDAQQVVMPFHQGPKRVQTAGREVELIRELVKKAAGYSSSGEIKKVEELLMVAADWAVSLDTRFRTRSGQGRITTNCDIILLNLARAEYCTGEFEASQRFASLLLDPPSTAWVDSSVRIDAWHLNAQIFCSRQDWKAAKSACSEAMSSAQGTVGIGSSEYKRSVSLLVHICRKRGRDATAERYAGTLSPGELGSYDQELNRDTRAFKRPPWLEETRNATDGIPLPYSPPPNDYSPGDKTELPMPVQTSTENTLSIPQAKDIVASVPPTEQRPKTPLELLESSGRTADSPDAAHWAASNNYESLISLLISQKKSSILAREPKTGRTPLHYAAEKGNMEVISLLTEEEGDLLGMNRRDHERGVSPFYLAVEAGHVKVVQPFCHPATDMFIQKDIKDRQLHQTPMHRAAANGHVGIMLGLLEADSSLADCIDALGDTPLHTATKAGQTEVVEALSDQCCLTTMAHDLKNYEGQTPLDIAKDKKFEKITGLLEELALEQRVPAALTPAEERKAQEMLAAEGFEVEDESAWHWAFERKQYNVILYIIAHKSDADGSTILHRAAATFDHMVIRSILETPNNSTSLNKRNNAGYTALQCAAEHLNVRNVRILLAQPGVDVGGALITAAAAAAKPASGGFNDLVTRVLLERAQGLDLNERDETGRTALHICAYYNFRVLTMLLEKPGLDPNARDNKGYTALHILMDAALEDKAIYLMRQPGVDINVPCNEGMTPLHLAVVGGRVEIVKELVLRGAKVNPQNTAGESPLHLAVKGSLSITHILLGTEGIQPNLRTKCGDTALDLAIRISSYHIVELLISSDVSSAEEVRTAYEKWVSGVSSESIASSTDGSVDMGVEQSTKQADDETRGQVKELMEGVIFPNGGAEQLGEAQMN